MTHIYQLDLATMVTLLTEQTGRLYTAGVQLPHIPSPCEVVVAVAAGQVQECRVLSQGRVCLEADAALQSVLPLGVLSWTYTPDVSLTASPPALAALVPERSRVVSLDELALWPRRQRVLYQLTDGTRSLEQLAHLLSQRLEVVVATLVVLEQQHAAIRFAALMQERHEAANMNVPAFLKADTH